MIVALIPYCIRPTLLITHPDAIQQAPAFAIVLLKGSLWQGNTGGGIVHRSPAIAPDSKRVLLALDADW